MLAQEVKQERKRTVGHRVRSMFAVGVNVT